MMFQPNRPFHRLAVVCVLVLCTSLLYLYETSSVYPEHRIPQHELSHFKGADQRLPGSLPGPPPPPPPPPRPAATPGYSIKPIAYVFPQYYVFEDNNRLHGENFTEWNNVRGVTHNSWGLETIRPHESIGGFYNGLAFETRQRQGRFLRESGFHGAVFHHYWFAGRPVMDHVIQAMLKDGEPNIPFMLSWANEPWSARWDGAGSSDAVLIAQEYGLRVAWRKHFDWLLPFFKHPQYIRSNGKVQFLLYNPSHVGHLGPPMFAAWRQWAVEEGLGGLDVIETRWGEGSNQGPSSWADFPPDAINEFAPHAGGNDQAAFSSLKKMSRVYHRGTLACWDTTPRHPTDGKAVSLPMCHPRTWQNHLVEMFRKIKSEPNPIGSENFFFVNALNEWGEGNSIEPSVQFGDGYGIAMKNAMKITEREHVWADQSIKDGLELERELAGIMGTTADVCVLVGATPDHAENKMFKLSDMLRSLQAQQNKNWRAVVYQTNTTEFPDLNRIVVQALDVRVKSATIPGEVMISGSEGKDAESVATNWVLKNLETVDPGCAAARYLLVTDASHTYEPSAFDALTKTEDIIALTVESRESIRDHVMLQGDISWADRCTRLEDPSLDLCAASSPNMVSSLAATFLNFPKFRAENYTLSQFTAKFLHQESSALDESSSTTYYQLTSTISPRSQTGECHVRHNPTYSSCLKTGNFWFDSPIFEEMGCYTTTDFIRIIGAKLPHLKGVDLDFFRRDGRCVRYNETEYDKQIQAQKPVSLAEDQKVEEPTELTSTADNKAEGGIVAG